MGMPKESDLEVKVGAFVLAAIVCLVVFVFSISDFSIFKKGESYRVMFQFANGLKKGAPVRVAGVDAGHVREIKVAYDAVARLTDVNVDIWMEQGHGIPVDSKFMINQLGLLGEKYLEIMPGSAESFVVPGATVRGEDPVPMETITKTLGSLGDKVGITLNSINTGILTDANKFALAVTLANLAKMTEGINTGILTEANKTALAATLANTAAVTDGIRNGQGTVGRFLTDPSVFKNMDELSADLKANPWKLFYRPKGK
jgi:phospholipid/cholesterol/gamma-HCH transport system substrate-binding protein